MFKYIWAISSCFFYLNSFSLFLSLSFIFFLFTTIRSPILRVSFRGTGFIQLLKVRIQCPLEFKYKYYLFIWKLLDCTRNILSHKDESESHGYEIRPRKKYFFYLVFTDRINRANKGQIFLQASDSSIFLPLYNLDFYSIRNRTFVSACYLVLRHDKPCWVILYQSQINNYNLQL